MSTEALIIRDDAALSVAFTARAIELKENALALAGVIWRVSNPEENAAAVGAQQELAGLIKLAEETRAECKKPILDFGRKIDETARRFIEELKAEQIRIAKLVGDFQALELAKQRAAENARMEGLSQLEKEREHLLAKAETHEEREAIQERFNQEAAALPVRVAAKAEGQCVVEEIVIDQIREFELMKERPDLVREVKFDLVALKALLKSGVKLKGVSFHTEIKSRVRATSPTKMLDVA